MEPPDVVPFFYIRGALSIVRSFDKLQRRIHRAKMARWILRLWQMVNEDFRLQAALSCKMRLANRTDRKREEKNREMRIPKWQWLCKEATSPYAIVRSFYTMC